MREVPAARAVPAAPPPRSWWGFAGAIALAVVVGAGLLGNYGIVVYRLRHSNAGRAALMQMHASPQLRQLLGEPVRLRIESGDLAHEGRASFEMQAWGPKGGATLSLESRVENHAWHVVRGSIAFPDRPEVPLDASPPPEAPPSTPATTSTAGRGPQP